MNRDIFLLPSSLYPRNQFLVQAGRCPGGAQVGRRMGRPRTVHSITLFPICRPESEPLEVSKEFILKRLRDAQGDQNPGKQLPCSSPFKSFLLCKCIPKTKAAVLSLKGHQGNLLAVFWVLPQTSGTSLLKPVSAGPQQDAGSEAGSPGRT